MPSYYMYLLYPILPNNPGKEGPIMENKQLSLMLLFFCKDTKLGAWCQSWVKFGFS